MSTEKVFRRFIRRSMIQTRKSHGMEWVTVPFDLSIIGQVGLCQAKKESVVCTTFRGSYGHTQSLTRLPLLFVDTQATRTEFQPPLS